MNATFDLKESLKLLRLLKTGRGPGTQWLRVTAIEEFLIFEAGQGLVWVPALVLEPGAFTTRRTPFNKVLASFTGSKTLTLQADAGRFRINSFSGQILDYDSKPKRPKGFEPIADESEPTPPGDNSADATVIAKNDSVAQPSAQKPSPTEAEVKRSAEFNGLDWEAYNEALEAAAQTLEKGGTFEQAIANAIEQMKVVQDGATIEHETAMENLIRSVFAKGVEPAARAKPYSTPKDVPKTIVHAVPDVAEEVHSPPPRAETEHKSDEEISNQATTAVKEDTFANAPLKAQEIDDTAGPKERVKSEPQIERKDSSIVPTVSAKILRALPAIAAAALLLYGFYKTSIVPHEMHLVRRRYVPDESLPYVFFQVLRLAVCGAACFGAFTLRHRQGWLWTFVILAVLFNPLAPIRLDRSIWQIIDLIAGITFLVSTVFFWNLSRPKQ